MAEHSQYELRGEIGGTEHCFLLFPGRNRIGSFAGANEVVLAARGVSRHHAALSVSPEGLTLRDLASKNGTFVNGARIEEANLTPGDEIRIGTIALRLVATGEDAGLAFGIEAPDRWPEVGEHETDLAPGHAGGGSDAFGARPAMRFPEGYVPGASPLMASLHRELLAVAAGDLPVLLLGETGVGKEHLARLVHAWSPRHAGPFVAVNCAAIPADLLEAEMFGIAKGVATGVQERAGKFELARNGTLFLDEIGDMPVTLQAKLLRALADREIWPLGGSPLRLDVRMVAATNGDLKKQIEGGRFRADLYFRLAGAVLAVPPLRQRPGDIPRLVERFVRTFSREEKRRVRGITTRALELLVEYSWPGNIRELEHEMRRLVHLCPDGQPIDTCLLSAAIRRPPPAETIAAPTGSLQLEERIASLERQLIQEALARTRGNRTRAAKLLGISRNGLAIKMERLGLAAG